MDAQENPPSNIVSSKLYEMQSYCMKTNHNFTTTIMAASPEREQDRVSGPQGQPYDSTDQTERRGYSALFTSLSPECQMDVISRAELEL